MATFLAKPETPRLAPQHPLGPRALAAWAMAEGRGPAVRDAAGARNHGTLYGNAAWSRGPFGACLTFPGTSTTDRAEFVQSPSLAVAGKGLTVAAWICPQGGFGGIVDKTIGGLTNTQFLLFLESSQPKFRVVSNPTGAASAQPNGSQFTAIGTALTLGQWVRVVGTYDGQAVRLYVNGVANGSTSAASFAIVNGSGPTYIGTLGSGIYPYSGRVDMVSIHARAWTPAEVARDAQDAFAPFRPRRLGQSLAILAAATLPPPPPPPPPPSGTLRRPRWLPPSRGRRTTR